MIGIILLITIGLFLLLALLWTEIRKETLSSLSCEKLIARLSPVQIEELALAAKEDCDTVYGARSLSDSQLWHLIGRWTGLRRIYLNVRLLLALAAQAQAWDIRGSYDTTLTVQRDAVVIRRAVIRILLQSLFRCRSERSLKYLKEAAIAYYTMTERLLVLYETSPSRLYTRLNVAVWPCLDGGVNMNSLFLSRTIDDVRDGTEQPRASSSR